MPLRSYETVPDELESYANVVADDFVARGFVVKVEQSELGFPYTPTFICKRQRTTVVVEVDTAIRLDRLDLWVRFCRSAGGDMRVLLCLPESVTVGAHDLAKLQALGVGLCSVFEKQAIESLTAKDLALGVSLPPLRSLPRKSQQLLGGAYDQFNRGEWREGFEDACQAFETAARRYLKHWSKTGRILVLTKKGPAKLPAKTIDKMTMGQLADTFGRIMAQTHSDALIGKALKALNRDRVGVAHHKTKLRTERRLRANVGRHMWMLAAALKEVG